MTDIHRAKIVAADRRLDRTTFSRLPQQAADAGRYRCPHCRADSELLAADFERRFGARTSALDPAWQACFTGSRPLREDEREGFVDFACRGCGAPVRIIYRAGQGWSMGCLEWQAVAVLEAEANTTGVR